MSDIRHGPDAISVLRDPATIRERCAAITRAVTQGRSSHFKLDRTRLDEAAARVEALTRQRFPDLRIPYHSRWRHFEAGGIDRKTELDALLAGRSPAEQARARIDLAFVSVLLDAGAGPQWTFREAQSGQPFKRSEGLGVASFRAFMDGVFSSLPGDPLRVDAAALQALDARALAAAFQSSPSNPLVGLEGRAALLRRLGAALPEHRGTALPAGAQGDRRPGQLFDQLSAAPVTAGGLLRAVLDGFSSIWLTGSVLHGVALGDVWPHPWAGGESAKSGQHGTTAGWVPFHKLSQWLCYSLLEPFEWAGVPVTGLDALTGLPEYRNGGLLMDTGVILPRDAAALDKRWQVHDEFIIEWRALTVTLLDELAVQVRARLGLTAEQMPLACVLEGGTWAAGRQIALEMRAASGGAPPLAIESDGTVF